MRFFVILVLVLLLIAALLFFRPGGYLIVNQPEKSDAIVILNGDQVTNRYWRGMELLRAGYDPAGAERSLNGRPSSRAGASARYHLFGRGLAGRRRTTAHAAPQDRLGP